MGGAELCRLIVLVIDISGSVSNENFALQRDATGDALASESITRLALSVPSVLTIAAVYFGDRAQVVVPWTPIRSEADTRQFAIALSGHGRTGNDWTAVGEGLAVALDLIENAPCEHDRAIIDISGDGRSNFGRPVEEQRDRAISMGVIINGLPIVNNEPNIVSYYENTVITPGGRVFEAQGWEEFARMMRAKLTHEVAELAIPRG